MTQFNNKHFIKPRDARPPRLMNGNKKKRIVPLSLLKIETAYRGEAKRRIRKRKVAKLMEMYANGISIIEIASALNYDQASVCYSLKKYFFIYRGDNPITIVLQSKV